MGDKRGTLTAAGARRIGWGRAGSKITYKLFKRKNGKYVHVLASDVYCAETGQRVSGVLSFTGTDRGIILEKA